MTLHSRVLQTVAERAEPGEQVEILARISTMSVAVTAPGGAVSRQEIQHVETHVRVFAGGRVGSVSTERIDEPGVRTAVDAARDALRTVPLRAREPAPLAVARSMTGPDLAGEGRAAERAADADALSPAEVDGVRDAAFAVSELERVALALTTPTTRTTLGHTDRTVLRALTGQGVVGYRTSEAQVHVLDTGQGRGAQAARVARSLDQIDVAGLLRDLEEARERLALPVVPYPHADWTVVEPGATARLLAWIVPALDTVWRGGAGRGDVLGRPGVTLVDDQGLEHPDGHAFDDFGFPGRTAVLIDEGRLVSPLTASDDPTSTTSSASRGQRVAAVPSLTRLRPFGATAAPESGTGVLIDSVSALGAIPGADTSTAQFSLGGVVLEGSTAVGRVRTRVSATVADLLGRVSAVHGPQTVHRFRGLHEGAWVHLDPFVPTLALQEG